MGTITSDTIDYRSGSGTLKLVESSLPTTTMLVESMSSLKLEFEIEDLKDKADTIFFGPSDLTFTVFETLGDGSSLFEEIDAITSTDEVEVQLDWTTRAGRSFTDLFYFTPNDVKYDRLGRRLTIESTFQAFGRAPIETDDYLSGNSGANPDHYTEVETFFVEGNTPTCMDPKTFINAVLEDVNTNNSVIVSTNSFEDQKNGLDTWVLSQSLAIRNVNDPTQVLYRLAAMDGSIVGSGMGYSFFIHRLDTSNDVSLSEDDYEVVNIELSNRNYSSIINLFMSNPQGATSWGTYSSTVDLNPSAPKSLIVFFFMTELTPAVWAPSNSRYENDPSSNVITTPQTPLDQKASEGSYLVYADTASFSYSAGDLITFHDDATTDYLPSGKNIYAIAETGSTLTRFANSLSGDQDKHTTDNPNRLVSFGDNRQSGYADNTNLAYQKAFGADGSRKIRLTVFGIDTVKPYQTFTLDSTAPPSIRNKTFRPSNINYLFKEDKAEIEAYEIA
jgi:hypothetical protein